jgi:hypothetical protein
MRIDVTRITPLGSHQTKRYELLVDGRRSFQARPIGGKLTLFRPRGKVSERNWEGRPSEVEIVGDEWGALVHLVTGWFTKEESFAGGGIELNRLEGVQEESEIKMRDPATKIVNLPLSEGTKSHLQREGFKHVSDLVKFLDAGGGPELGAAMVEEITAALVHQAE